MNIKGINYVLFTPSCGNVVLFIFGGPSTCVTPLNILVSRTCIWDNNENMIFKSGSNTTLHKNRCQQNQHSDIQ